jgi:hypothetical protein
MTFVVGQREALENVNFDLHETVLGWEPDQTTKKENFVRLFNSQLFPNVNSTWAAMKSPFSIHTERWIMFCRFKRKEMRLSGPTASELEEIVFTNEEAGI